jgi:hypothetical protein
MTKFDLCFLILSDNFLVITPFTTELRGRVARTLASYSGNPMFKPRSVDRLALLMLFVVLFSPSRQMPG